MDFDFSQLTSVFAQVCTLWGLATIFLGVLFGIVIGAIPGMSPSMGVALLVPFSYGADPALAFLLFVSAYQAANYGGSITAIAINTPGTPAAVVTAIDGYELSKQGRARAALQVAVLSSTVGGMIGCAVLILFTAPVAAFALSFGPAEYFSIAVFGLATVIAFGKNNLVKSSIAVLLGLLISTVGVDPFSGAPRYTFNTFELYEGIALVPALIGLFALGEIFMQVLSPRKQDTTTIESGQNEQILPQWIATLPTVIRSSCIGTAIGVIPGAGATIASFVSYAYAQKKSTQQDTFGHGALEGVSASEAANSSSVGGALIPLLALGIPGSATDAVLLGALTLHGLVAGPALMQENTALVYSIFLAVLIANILILIVGSFGNRLWLQLIKAPYQVVAVLVCAMAILGSYTVQNSLFDVAVCISFGLLGLTCKLFKIPPAAVILGMVLGGMIEMNLRRALLSQSFFDMFTSSPIAFFFLLLTALSILSPIIRRPR